VAARVDRLRGVRRRPPAPVGVSASRRRCDTMVE
jgi:hypothetical protein